MNRPIVPLAFKQKALPFSAALLLLFPAGARAETGGVIVVSWGKISSVPAGLGKVKAIAAGSNHNLVVKEDGTVAAWGDNSWGQCNVPAGLLGVKAVSGVSHSLALREDGTVAAWGLNNYGQCTVPSGLASVKAISAGGMHSLALRENGTVAVWGDNYWGQRNVPGGLGVVKAIAAGGTHNLVLKADGTVAAWGANVGGQCDVPPGLTGVRAIAAGAGHSLALRENGTIVGWGDNYWNQYAFPAGLDHVAAIAAGSYHSIALREDGTLVACGVREGNQYGQATVPDGLAGVKAISTGPGSSHNLVLAHFLECQPQEYDFGKVGLGEEVSKTFSLANASPVTYTLGQLAVLPGAQTEGDFMFSDDCSGQAIGPGQSLSFTVTFRPLLNGPRSTAVRIPVGARFIEAGVRGTGGGDGLSSLVPVVYDGATGQPLAGASVTVDGETLASGPDGKCVFSALAPGLYTVAAEKEDYSSSAKEVELPASSNIYRNVILYPSNFTEPVVNDISSKYEGRVFYVDGVNFNVTHNADIDWSGHQPGRVDFITPRGIFAVPPDGGRASKSFNMGSDFGPEGTLKVQAVTASGAISEEKTADFAVIRPIPLFPLMVADTGTVFSYSSSLGLNWNLFSEEVGGASIPADIPLFGGNPFLLKLVPTVSAGVSCDGTASVGLQFKGLQQEKKIETGRMAGFSVSLYPQVEIEGRYYPDYGGWDWSGYAGMHGEVDFKKSWPFVVWVGPVPVPMYAKISLSLSADAMLGIVDIDPLAVNGRFALGPYVRGSLGAGADEMLAVEGWIGGGVDIGLQFPQEPTLDELTIYINGGFTVYALLFTWENELLRWDWSLLENSASGSGPAALAAAEPAVLSRDYLRAENYGLFSGGAAGKQAAAEEALVTRRLSLQENIFPYPEPALASAGTHLYAAWLEDDPARGVLNRTRLVFSSWDGASWSAPQPIHDDGTADFHPDIIAFPDGWAVAAWENARTTLPDDASIEDMKDNLEISVAFFDPDLRAWTAPWTLTDNGYLDRSPRVRGFDRDNLMVTWVANEASHITGNTASPNGVWSAVWNGAAWAAPEPVVDSTAHPDFKKPLISYDLAYLEGESASGAFFCLDMDDDVATDTDRQIFRVFRHPPEDPSGARWDDPVQMTNDSLATGSIRFATGEAVPSAYWVKDDTLYSATPSASTATARYSFEEFSSNIASFRITGAPNGRRALVWSEPSEFSADLWTAFFDPVSGVWGRPQQLTRDDLLERCPAVAFYGDDILVCMHDAVAVDTVIEQRATLSGEIRPVPTRRLGAVELAVLLHEVTTDLALEPGSLLVDPANPRAGSVAEIFVTVVNAGSTAPAGITVSFYAGDPLAGGLLIGSVVVADPLPPGEQKTVSVSWTVPSVPEPVTIYAVVDPEGLIGDAVPGNNTLAMDCLFPDIKAVGLARHRITGDINSLIGTVQNIGALGTGAFDVEIRKDTPDGQLLHRETLPGLAPGETRQVACTWDTAGTVMENMLLCLVADPENEVAERDETNNIYFLKINPALSLLKGDIDGDGLVGFSDVAACLRMVAGRLATSGGMVYSTPYPVRMKAAADLDGNLDISVIDALLIMRKAAGLDE